MQRIFPAAALAATLALPVLAQPIVAKLDGRVLQFDQPPVLVGGRVMVPLRGIFESLGANVRFEAASQRIMASRGSQSVELTLGSNQAMVDGQPVTLDSPATSLGGRTMVPLRFVSEALGTEVRWQESTQTVFLTTTSAGSEAAPPPPAPQPKQPPRLNGVSHNARASLRGGDQLVVSASGTRNGKATFDILGVVENQPMSEVQPGEYRGNFTVPNRLRVSQGTLLVHLSKNGQVTQLEANRPVTFNAQQQPGGAGGRLDIGSLNLRPGQPVRAVFEVQGQTLPGANVQITGRSPRFPGTLQAGGSADGKGRFQIQMNATAVPDNSPLQLSIVASDRSGRQGTPRQIQVFRR
ncbi:MAG: copper amine oxidase N-terminal domain-containing protein [Candidatus Eremiobacteraeota bacterium]|nr:copper amine oxidase N-terminal domain-containing protein [Candidatus Eremiobacteraeota bacterium]MCW5868846.1 copper amine oxidase N-terminal domain-containing protein [Candidatus Eremiobacteraeota bacterium]